MLENFLFEAESKDSHFKIILSGLIITFVLAIVNSYIGGNSLFLVALISLALSYPYVNYIRSMNKEELEQQMSEKRIIFRHQRELIVLWSLFIGVMLGFIISAPLISDYTYQQAFISEISGHATKTNLSFTDIFLNNLEVNALTFAISFLVSSGLLFVIIWNISIISYYLQTIGGYDIAIKTALMILPHGLLEIGGYIFAGIAGALLAMKIDRKRKFDHKLDKQFYMDFSYLALFSITLIFIGAALEVL
jgi:uncharacterized membrane protein SpoIIM required for sporulation